MKDEGSMSGQALVILCDWSEKLIAESENYFSAEKK